MHVLICGGGVIGAATARFLACGGAEVTIVEGTGAAGAGSQIGRISGASRWLAAEAPVPRCRRSRPRTRRRRPPARTAGIRLALRGDRRLTQQITVTLA